MDGQIRLRFALTSLCPVFFITLLVYFKVLKKPFVLVFAFAYIFTVENEN